MLGFAAPVMKAGRLAWAAMCLVVHKLDRSSTDVRTAVARAGGGDGGWSL